MPTLGPFRVSDIIARGGMGAVYAAHDLVEGYAAAIKVVPPNDTTRERLLAEVRTTAALNHPSIVAIYDYGEVTMTEALASDGEFAPHALWFAMERATSGSLETMGRPRNWRELRRLLLEVLDALAHAHARGCIHRDLKPANVLVTERDQGIAYLLADFGIAHVVDPEGVLPESTDTINAPAAGTPQFMAPEQIQARWRDQGPWTDLYSLGCMAWELATGRPVFGGETAVHVAMAHLSTKPGAFAAQFAVPVGFEDWLRLLLEKDSHARYSRAALAAAVLAELPGVADNSGELVDDTNPSLPTLDSMPTFKLPSVQLQAIRKTDALIPPGTRPHVVRHVAPDWRPTRRARPVGARTGLGLFGIREIGVQGRQTERDMLWQALREAEETSRVTACLLEGDEGLGKSRLLRWFGVRVDELGIGTVLRASHAHTHGPSSGLAFALARHFGCVGLDRESCRARIERLTSGSIDALTEVLNPGEDGARSNIRFGSPAERYRVIADYLRRLGTKSPVVLLLDDVQWGSDSLGFVQFLLQEPVAAPIVVVMGLDNVALSERPLATRRMAAIRTNPVVRPIALEPLGHDEHRALVREQARLSSALADDLVVMSGGDTNYSICVLGDWVERGVLELGTDGYGFASEAAVAFPRDLAEAWGARVDRFCAQFAMPGRVAEALAVAAVLGTEVDLREWRATCALRGLEPDDRLVSRLVDAGIARETEIGFQLAQGAITETLVNRATASGTIADIHAACAAAISRTGFRAITAERRGVHLLGAGETERALVALGEALDARMETSAYDEAIAVADLWLASTASTAHEAALLVRARRADAHRFLGDHTLAESEANTILELADRSGSARARGEGLRVLAGLEHGRGQLENGIRRYTDAIAAYRRANDSRGVARSVHGRGWLHLNRGAVTAARADFKLGMELADRSDIPVDSAWSAQGLAEAASIDGDASLAEETARRAIAQFESFGSRSGRGMALTTLGNVLASSGRLDEARIAYDASIDLLASFDSQLISFALAHRIAFELMVRDTVLARQYVRRAHNSPLTPAFRAVVALASLTTEPAGQSTDALGFLRENWAVVGSNPLVQRVAEMVDAQLENPAELRAIIG